jgi:hypothetical protein
MGISHVDQYTFFIISRSILLGMRNVSHKSCIENKNARFMVSNFFFFEIRAVYQIMWKNTVQVGSPQKKVWCLRTARWVSRATNTHSEYLLRFH